MNKKAQIEIFALIVIGIILLLVFTSSLLTATKIFNIFTIIPKFVWYGLIALVLWKMFGGKK